MVHTRWFIRVTYVFSFVYISSLKSLKCLQNMWKLVVFTCATEYVQHIDSEGVCAWHVDTLHIMERFVTTKAQT